MVKIINWTDEPFQESETETSDDEDEDVEVQHDEKPPDLLDAPNPLPRAVSSSSQPAASEKEVAGPSSQSAEVDDYARGTHNILQFGVVTRPWNMLSKYGQNLEMHRYLGHGPITSEGLSKLVPNIQHLSGSANGRYTSKPQFTFTLSEPDTPPDNDTDDNRCTEDESTSATASENSFDLSSEGSKADVSEDSTKEKSNGIGEKEQLAAAAARVALMSSPELSDFEDTDMSDSLLPPDYEDLDDNQVDYTPVYANSLRSRDYDHSDQPYPELLENAEKAPSEAMQANEAAALPAANKVHEAWLGSDEVDEAGALPSSGKADEAAAQPALDKARETAALLTLDEADKADEAAALPALVKADETATQPALDKARETAALPTLDDADDAATLRTLDAADEARALATSDEAAALPVSEEATALPVSNEAGEAAALPDSEETGEAAALPTSSAVKDSWEEWAQDDRLFAIDSEVAAPQPSTSKEEHPLSPASQRRKTKQKNRQRVREKQTSVLLKHHVFVPTDKVGRIVGKGGKRIKEIENKTGARLEIENRKSSKPATRIHLYGTNEQILAADREVCLVIRNFKPPKSGEPTTVSMTNYEEIELKKLLLDIKKQVLDGEKNCQDS